MNPVPSRIGVVINPISGRHGVRADTGSRRLALAHELARGTGIEIEAVLARARYHASELAQDFVRRRFDAVFAWGGDGTVNEVAGPLIGSETALGIIPSGSGDGLARSLRLPREPRAAFSHALQSEPRLIDVGYLADRHFLNVAGIGFDAAIGVAFNRGKKRGLLRYVAHGLNLVWGYRARQYDLRLDDDRLDGERFLVAFANGREYGNRLMLAPTADPCDGWLDVVLVDSGSALQQLWRARRLFHSPAEPATGIHRYRATRATVRSDLLTCHVDGETFETSGEVEVRLRTKALLVRGA